VFLSDDFTHPSSILQFTAAAERRGIKPDRLAPNKIAKVLGRKESIRFFKAVYDALPKETITYMSVMVRVFEKFI
jgi:hypothetical protein